LTSANEEPLVNENMPVFVLGFKAEVSGEVVPANPKNEEPS
jgi:hypothetical protein